MVYSNRPNNGEAGPHRRVRGAKMRDDDGVLLHQRSIREAKNTKHVNSLVLYNAIKDDDGMI